MSRWSPLASPMFQGYGFVAGLGGGMGSALERCLLGLNPIFPRSPTAGLAPREAEATHVTSGDILSCHVLSRTSRLVLRREHILRRPRGKRQPEHPPGHPGVLRGAAAQGRHRPRGSLSPSGL